MPSKTINFSILTVILSMALMCGCAVPPEVSVTSKLSADYKVDLDRVYVVLDTREFDEDTRRIGRSGSKNGEAVADTVSFSTHFLDELATKFAALDVKYKFYRYTGIELSKDEYLLPAKQFGADEVLWISGEYSHTLSEAGFMGLWSTSEITDFILVAHVLGDIDNEERAWRALIEVGQGNGGWSLKARLAASSLVDKLVADGLINEGE